MNENTTGFRKCERCGRSYNEEALYCQWCSEPNPTLDQVRQDLEWKSKFAEQERQQEAAAFLAGMEGW